jgi:ribosomal protein S25
MSKDDARERAVLGRRDQEKAARADKRSRLPDAVDALLRTPVLTPIALAARLKVAPQTATAVLRTLRDEGVVREVTRRGRFRAFAM